MNKMTFAVTGSSIGSTNIDLNDPKYQKMIENISQLYHQQTTGSIGVQLGQFKQFALPLVRSPAAQLYSVPLTRIQPLPAPSGQIFYMDYTYMKDSKEQIFTFDEMIKAGVMPWTDDGHDMNRLLEGLSTDEQRIMKRKFRKLWRKHRKAITAKAKERPIWSIAAESLGKAGVRPTRAQRRARRAAVAREFATLAQSRMQALKTTGEEPKKS